MSNTFIVIKIQQSNFTSYIIDWVYGTDDTSLGGSTITSLASIPLADRQDTEVVGTFMQEELGSAFFLEKDAELLVQQPPKP
jgi:hypothetical protein